MHVVKSWSDFDILEEGHTEDGKDEHDKEEQQADVDQGRKGHHQGEEKRSYSFGSLDEPEDAAHFSHSDYPEERRRNKIFLDKVT